MTFTSYIDQVRAERPLVHHITNYVTVNDCANACLAIGASPVMADAVDEAESMVSIAQSLVLNIGTLNVTKVEAMMVAGRKANALGIPVVFDPVGVGATPFRNRMAAELMCRRGPGRCQGRGRGRFDAGEEMACDGRHQRQDGYHHRWEKGHAYPQWLSGDVGYHGFRLHVYHTRRCVCRCAFGGSLRRLCRGDALDGDRGRKSLEIIRSSGAWSFPHGHSG